MKPCQCKLPKSLMLWAIALLLLKCH